jgi:hypothetical protein
MDEVLENNKYGKLLAYKLIGAEIGEPSPSVMKGKGKGNGLSEIEGVDGVENTSELQPPK